MRTAIVMSGTAGIESKAHATTILSFERARNHERRSEFIIDKQELTDRIEKTWPPAFEVQGHFGQEFW